MCVRDAWSRLGDMSSERAMAAYVDEMKKVAQEVSGPLRPGSSWFCCSADVCLQVIDSTPMDQNAAALFHHFEPLYQVINDMPRPPQALLALREGQ